MKFIEDLTERAKEAKRIKEDERKEAVYKAAEKHSRLKLKQKLDTKDIYEKSDLKPPITHKMITTPEPTDDKIIVLKQDKNNNIHKKLAELPNHQVNVKIKTDDADEWNKKPRFSMPKRTEGRDKKSHICAICSIENSPKMLITTYYSKQIFWNL